MKLKNLFWFATGASISYHLVKKRCGALGRVFGGKTAKKSKQR